MPICIHCHEEKQQHEFGKRGASYRNVCKVCHNLQKRKWSLENPVKRADSIHKHYAKKVGKDIEKCRAVRLTDEQRKANIKNGKKSYYLKNRETILEKTKIRYENNKDAIASYRRQWLSENKDRKSASDKAWRQRNLAKTNAYSATRHAAKMQATPTWLSAIEQAQIQEMYDVALAKSVQTGIKHHVDHIHPLQGENFNGLHVPWNLRVISASENLSKGNNLPFEKACLGWEG